MTRYQHLLLAVIVAALALAAGCSRETGLPAEPDVTSPSAPPGTPLRLVPLARPQAGQDGIRVRVPVPPGRLANGQQLQVVNEQGNALPTQSRVLTTWPATLTVPGAGTPRLVELQIPGDLQTLLGTTLYLQLQPEQVTNSQATLVQPLAAAASLDPQWHIDAFFFGRGLPLTPDSHWFDLSMLGYTQTVINALPDSVKAAERIDLTRPAPWLFDRPSVLFDIYLRSADIRLFTEAEKASRDYVSLLDESGHFRLKPGDLKYVYPRSLFYRWQLFGEASQAERIERMAALARQWPMDGRGAGFWTERHTAYAFGALLTAWELTAKPEYLTQLESATVSLLVMSEQRLANGRPAHCPAHTLQAHEGRQSDQLVCSPWMLALLVQPLDRYYLLSGDTRAARLLGHIHQYLRDTALYQVSDTDPNVKLRGHWLPWYLASNDFTFSDNGPFGDLEHSCDVAGALAHTSTYDDSNPVLSRNRLMALMESCRFNLQMWHRPGSDIQHGKPVWRLAPPRKFNWWFGSTQALTWWLQQDR